MIIKIIIWIVILAIFHSLLEIQVEGGKSGWARHLPTFRINNFLIKLIIGKELTGYHVFMLGMFITIFHGIFLFEQWTIKTELQVWGWYSIYFVVEDFLWFIFNKHYRLKNFRKGRISWHKRWFLGLPVSYWIGILGGILLLIIGLK